MVWMFRACLALTAAVALFSSILLARAFVGLAGSGAAILGLVALGVVAILGGLSGGLYVKQRDAGRNHASPEEEQGEAASAGVRPDGNSRALLAFGVVAVTASSAAAIYGLAVEGEVSSMRGASLLVSCLLLGIAIWLFMRRR